MNTAASSLGKAKQPAVLDAEPHPGNVEFSCEAPRVRFAYPGYLLSYGFGITASVSRDMHTSLPASFSMRISHTWVLRPT